MRGNGVRQDGSRGVFDRGAKNEHAVLVHRAQLPDQWRQRLAAFLELPIERIGQISGGNTKRTGFIDVALIQSLHRKGETKDLVAEYGHIVVDECHHLSAVTFEQVMRQVKAKYVLGLTAAPVRKDGRHPIIYMQCGPIRFNLPVRAQMESSPFEHRVKPQTTTVTWTRELPPTIQDLYGLLAVDAERNSQIVRDVTRAVANGTSPLVLSGRTDHVEWLGVRLREHIERVVVLKGGMGPKQRAKVTEELAATEGCPRIIVATGSYIGEGFDDSSTRSFSQCRSHGAAHCSNMSGGFIACTTARKWWRSTTTLTLRYRCSPACSINDFGDTRPRDMRSTREMVRSPKVKRID